MKIACVLINHFPLSAELLRNPELKNKPAILVYNHEGRSSVLDYSPALSGLFPDMPLQTALSRCKDVTLINSEMSYYHSTYEGILKNLWQVVPAMENSGLGHTYLDIYGLEDVYGSRDILLEAIRNAIPAAFKTRIGIASTKYTSYVAATDAAESKSIEVSTDAGIFLKEHPVDILPIGWRTIERLRSFGFMSLGQIAATPVGPLQSQFGREGYEMWHLANGIDKRPILPWNPVEYITEHLSFPAPTITLDVILLAVNNLLSRAFSWPKLGNGYVRGVTLKSQTSNGCVWQHRVTFKEPLGSKQQALFAIKNSIEARNIPGPLEDMELVLFGLMREKGRQESLFLHMRRQQQLKEALQQLEARLGKKPPIFHIKRMEPWSRIPERRQALMPFNL